MYSIGEFASLARVSVRMLRHYDSIGLLMPAEVDPASGYRRYGDLQLERIGRILVYKDLGFGLDEVARIVDGLPDRELHELLTRRRQELTLAVDADRQRLERVEARLRAIEGEDPMSITTVELTTLPALHLLELSAEVTEMSQIGPVIGPMFGRLEGAVRSAGIEPAGPFVAYYGAGSGDSTGVHAAVPVADDGTDRDVAGAVGLDVAELPAAELAAELIHEGGMESIQSSWAALWDWTERNGYVVSGSSREIYLRMMPHPVEEWRTALQVPVRHSS